MLPRNVEEATLTEHDVAKLLENPSTEARLQILEKVSANYTGANFTPEQRNLAEQIFRVLLYDAEIKVRQSLSEHLKDVETAPKDIILTLAKDVDDVSIPVLQYSEVLDDNDLIHIIETTKSMARHLAISNRKTVNVSVSDALIDHSDKSVVKNLVERVGAKLSEVSLTKVFDKFHEDDSIMECLANREQLPITVIEKMITSVSEALKQKLIHKYKDNEEIIHRIIDKSREAATFKFMGLDAEDADVKELVSAMRKTEHQAHELHVGDEKISQLVDTVQRTGKFGPLSALSMGHSELFEISLAKITHVPVANVRKLMHDVSGNGFKALYHKAHLPEELLEAVKLVVDVMLEMEREEGKSNRKDPKIFISRILMRSATEKKEIPNLSYFISMIHQHTKH